MRHTLDGFILIGSMRFDGEGGVLAQQRFVDDEPYRAARHRGLLMIDKFASRRRFSGWGHWAKERIRVRPVAKTRSSNFEMTASRKKVR